MSNSTSRRVSGWLTPKARVGAVNKTGHRAVFAAEPLAAGEIVCVWGGNVVDHATLSCLSPDDFRLALQIEEHLYIVSSTEGPADWINHSCEPNAGLSGQLVLVAMRAIEAGEEICYDYAMTDGSPYDEFDCSCGAEACRGRVTGNDWQNPELWARYGSNFAPYLIRRIAELRPLRVVVQPGEADGPPTKAARAARRPR